MAPSALIKSFIVAQNDNLQVHEEKSKGVYVKNLSDYYVSSAREVYEIMRTGGAARVISSTSKRLSCITIPAPSKNIPRHRYECGIVSISFHILDYHTAAEHRVRRSENGQPLPRRLGWFRESRQNRSIGPDTRGSEED
jgi:hypothetical protein